MVPATPVRRSARRARLSFFLTPVSILLIIVSPWRATLAADTGATRTDTGATQADTGATQADTSARDAAALAAVPPHSQHSARYPRSASRGFLQLISGYDIAAADDDWAPLTGPQLSAPSSGRAGRTGRAGRAGRERVRVSALPVLLLPVAVQDAGESDEYTGRPSRRRIPAEYDSDVEDERPPRRRSWTRRPAADEPAPWRPAAAEGPVPWRPEHTEYASESAFGAPGDKPDVGPAESSQRLVEMFRSQAPRGDGEAAPPAIVQSEFDRSERVLLLDHDDQDDDEWAPPARTRRALKGEAAVRGGEAAVRGGAAPAPPRLAHPLKLNAVLTVPRAGYSETYTAWWDPRSGDSRVHFQDGSTVTFRKMLPNGLVQKVEMHVDRSSGRVLRRCAASVSVAGAADRRHPALPDLRLFTFAGHVDGAERWEHRAEQAARGEALAARHELLLLRDRDDSAVPLRYSVAVNSSLLGADCDEYRHDYFDVRYHNRGPDFFQADLDELCDEVRQLNASSADALARLEPLREFTLPQRDPRHDAVLERFKIQNERQYADDAEEAVRKNLVMQSSRFTASGNRAGATFQLGLNFLADRLDAELRGLRGVAHDSEPSRAERFPYPRRALSALEPRLPAAFDWRAQGGVTPVRYQGTSCASCWAFATAGAVEGALFRRSGRLTPLSEQQLVDCAHAFGANGCKGTWPSRAYDYIQERGLSALDDYTPYNGKVESCQEESVAPVTRISGHVNVTKYSVPALKVAIKQHGPAVVIVDSSAKSFTLYKKGVLYDDRCSKKSAKHAVLAVGWGQERGEPYFVLKNSWSEAWGERGYVRVQARANTCGVLTHPSHPRLERDDVLQR